MKKRILNFIQTLHFDFGIITNSFVVFCFSLLTFYRQIEFNENGYEVPKVRLFMLVSVFYLSLFIGFRTVDFIFYIKRDHKRLVSNFQKFKLIKFNDVKVLLNSHKIKLFALIAIIACSIGSLASQYTIYNAILIPNNGIDISDFSNKVAINGNIYREQGLVFFLILILCSIIISSTISRSTIKIIAISIIVSSIFHIEYAIQQVGMLIDQQPVSLLDGFYVNGYFAQSEFYFSYLTLGLISTHYIFRMTLKRISVASRKWMFLLLNLIKYLVYLTLIIGIGISVSWWGYAVTYFVVFIFFVESHLFKQVKYFQRLLLFLIIFSSIVIFPIMNFIGKEYSELSSRSDIWSKTLTIYIYNPINERNYGLLLFGSGYDTLMYQQHAEGIYMDQNIDRAHNILLDVLAFTGLIGVLCVVIAICYIFLRKYPKTDTFKYLLFIFSILWIRGLVHTNSTIDLIILFIVGGILINSQKSKSLQDINS